MEQTIQISPIGYVRNKTRGRSPRTPWQETVARMKAEGEAVSEIIINVGLEAALDGIEEFSHIVVIYWPHLLPPESRTLTKVHPLGSPDFPEVGVFATRSPARPNPILTATVRLLGREGNVLRVVGLDALDGSPVLDIKPYLPERAGKARIPAWMRRINRRFEDPGDG